MDLAAPQRIDQQVSSLGEALVSLSKIWNEPGQEGHERTSPSNDQVHYVILCEGVDDGMQRASVKAELLRATRDLVFDQESSKCRA